MEFVRVVAIVFFLVMNALFVLAEFAIVSVRRTRIEELAQNEKNILARTTLEILDDLNSYLAAIQLGITGASIGLGWLAQPYIAGLIRELIPEIDIPSLKISSYSISLAISFFFVTFIHIVLGEQVPKYIAISSSENVALLFSLPLKLFYKISYYPMLVINKTSKFFASLLGFRSLRKHSTPSEDEIKLILSKSQELGKISLQRLMMFEHLFDFGKARVKEVMVPKEKIVCLEKGISFSELLKVVKEKRFSRYPVVDEKGCFIGYVHIKDIIFNLPPSEEKNFSLMSYLRELKKVGENEMIERSLRFIQETHQPMLLVEDEKGDVVGLITVEDIIENLTGEIRDEFEIKPVVRLDEIFSIEGSVVGLNSQDRFSAISEMVDNLYKKGILQFKDEIKEKILKRERELSTAIGHQIALPHARIEGLKKPILTVGISREGVEFSSPDKKPVKVIFLILTPYHEPSTQLNILSKISRLISNLTLRNKLLKTENPYVVKEILTVFEDNVPC